MRNIDDHQAPARDFQGKEGESELDRQACQNDSLMLQI
jgi:hypothetical protein